MIATIVRALILAAHARALWPDADPARVGAAAIAAVAAETDIAPSSLLLAIAQHESDLEPTAVSWRANGGQRVDILWSDRRGPPVDIPLACGLVATIAVSRARCAELLDPRAAARAGAAELAEHARGCAGSLRCALSAYAGGNAGRRAALAGRRTQATDFADLFIRRAVALGMARPTS